MRDRDYNDTLLPRRVARRVIGAADRAMQEVLEEDRQLREHGIMPARGRSR
jgi:hypothetical protein